MFEGATIGQYRLLRKIGEGGMGAVYLGEHTLVGRRAAIKVLLPELSARREIVERFFNEARAMTAVADPGIVQMFDFGYHSNGSAYLVMELLEGETLDQRLKRLHLLLPAEALRITRQVAGSLAAAHARNIVHRDLKPENIFMIRDQEALGGERAKILDFGIAKLGNDTGRNATMAGALMGTPMYMSPEQCRGAGLVDYRSDIYSLGCVLFHLLTGRPPFEAEGMGEILAMHMREPAPPPSMFVQGFVAGIDELVLRCLAKAPTDRFQSMTELQGACDRLLAYLSAQGPSAPTVALATPLSPGFRSVTPGAGTALLPGTVPPAAKPTTLSTASGQTGNSAPRRRTGVWIGLGLGLVAGGIALAVVATRGDAGAGGDAAPAEHAPVAPPAAQPAAEKPAAQPAPQPPAPQPAPPPPSPPPAPPAAVPPTAPPVPDATKPPAKPVAKPAAKPTAKPKPAAPTAPAKPQEDLYDDR